MTLGDDVHARRLATETHLFRGEHRGLVGEVDVEAPCDVEGVVRGTPDLDADEAIKKAVRDGAVPEHGGSPRPRVARPGPGHDPQSRAQRRLEAAGRTSRDGTQATLIATCPVLRLSQGTVDTSAPSVPRALVRQRQLALESDELLVKLPDPPSGVVGRSPR